MTDKTILDLGGPLASPAADDLIPIWDTSAGQTLRIRRDALVGAVLTGDGTIATGGYTLTVPATGTAALLSTANTFTAANTFNAGIDVRAHSASNTWGIDVADGPTVALTNGTAFSLSGDATFQGLLLIGSTVDGQVALFVVGGGVVVKVADGGNVYATVKDTSSKTNVHFESGQYWVQNYSGADRVYTIFSVRLRASS
jgi:hypothetical protein